MLHAHEKQQILRNIGLVCIWLFVINGYALLGLNRLNVMPDRAFSWINPKTFRTLHHWNVIKLHAKWDSTWFLDVAKNGYYMRGENQFSNVVFFPMYPAAIRLVSYLTGGNLILAGWIVSSLFLAASVALLTRLTQRFHPEIDPLWPTIFLLVFPTAFFLNAIYSEAMFLFFSIATFYFAFQKRFWTAALFAALASATRMAGVFLFFPLLVEFIQTQGWRSLFSRSVLPLCLAPCGALAFFLYHYFRFGDFFLYLKVESWWGRDFSGDLDDLDKIVSYSGLTNWMIEWGFAIFGFAAAVAVLWKLRRSYGIYMLISMAVAFASGGTFGIGRYCMVLFPTYLLAASIRSVPVRSAWILTSTLLLSLDTLLFINTYWAG
jgi:hypothetical protein